MSLPVYRSIIAHDEADAAIRSVRDWVDEVVAADSGGTVGLRARRLGSRDLIDAVRSLWWVAGSVRASLGREPQPYLTVEGC